MIVKDRDSQDTVLRLRALPFAIIAALLFLVPALLMGASLLAAIAGAAVAFLIVLLVPGLVADRTAAAGASIYTASGASTPALRQYSLADSLVARGKFDEAAEAYELLSEDHPDDPEPRIRLARLLRDHMQQLDSSAEWFRKALVKKISPSTEVAVLRELSELYTHKLHTPERALPFLRRLYETHPAHPAAAWARTEYAEIKNNLNV